MKRTSTSLILGICLAILAVAASSAYARSTTAFSSFKVESPLVLTGSSVSPYTCLGEDNGAVVNHCSQDINLEFGMESDSSGTKTITVQNYWNGTDAQNTFSCDTYAYTGSQGSSSPGTTISFTAPGQKFSSTIAVKAGESIQLICWNVPQGGGVANISWTK